MSVYDYYTVPTPMVSGDFSDMNSAGQIVGFSFDGDDGFGFEDIGGSITELDPTGYSCFIGGINDAGIVVGATQSPVYGFCIAEITGNGVSYVTLPSGLTLDTVTGINDSDTIVGTLDDATGEDAFRYQSGVFKPGVVTIIHVPASVRTVGRGVSNSGNVVGFYTDSEGKTSGFISESSKILTISVPGSNSTVANGINNSGTVVGTYQDGTLDANGAAAEYGFIYSKGVFTKIDYEGQHDTELTSIDDGGVILGQSFDRAAQAERPFVVTPHGTSSPIGDLSYTAAAPDVSQLAINISASIELSDVGSAGVSGAVADTAGMVSGVELYNLSGSTRIDLGAASIDATAGTWSFVTALDSGTFRLEAIATDQDGITSMAVAPFTFVAGITGQPYATIVNSLAAPGGATVGQTYYAEDGSIYLTEATTRRSDGSVIYAYSGGSYFTGKAFHSFANTYDTASHLVSTAY